jgi:hypothetical protein
MLERLGAERYRRLTEAAQREAERRFALYEKIAAISWTENAAPSDGPAAGASK